MRAQGDIQPIPVTINRLPNGTAEIILCENIEQKDDAFEFDQYILRVTNRETLETDVETNFDQWITLAKVIENQKKNKTSDEIIADLGKQTTDLQLALCEVYEIMLGAL